MIHHILSGKEFGVSAGECVRYLHLKVIQHAVTCMHLKVMHHILLSGKEFGVSAGECCNVYLHLKVMQQYDTSHPEWEGVWRLSW